MLESTLTTSWPPAPWRDVTVVAAVSGGADSTALLRWLARERDAASSRLVVAHYNHRWRGADSDGDEAFVRELTSSLQLPCEVGVAETGEPASDGDGLEAAARERRYRFLVETAQKLGARYVVTAHTADDQVETIVHRFLRGSGPGGLSGIPRTRGLSAGVTLLRPMLEVTRADVLDYLTRLKQPYRQDISNRDARFTRCRIRHELLPQLREQFNPRVDDAVLRLGRLSGELRQLVRSLVDDLLQRAVQFVATDEVRVEVGSLRDTPVYLLRELLIAIWKSRGWPQQEMGFERWDELSAMLRGSEDGSLTKRDFPGGVSAERTREILILRK